MILNQKIGYQQYHRYFANLRQLAEREDVRSFTNLTLSLFTIAFFGFFAIKPTLVIIAKLNKEIKDKQEIQVKLQNKIGSLVKAQEEYAQHENRFYLIDQALPKNPDLPSLILPLEKEASLAGVQIQSFSIAKIEIIRGKKSRIEKEDVLSFEFNTTLTGDYPNLLKFLGRTDSLRRLIALDNVSFGQTKKNKDEQLKILLTISGNSKFYPPDSEKL